MNLAGLFQACLSVLGRGEWRHRMNLTRRGFAVSFLAPILTVPCYFVCAAAVMKNRAAITGAEAGPPTLLFFIVLALYAASFILSAYVISLAFDRMEKFGPWVIMRHWCMFFAALFAAFIMGLYILGFLPFGLVMNAALILYVGTLFIDIRLAQRAAGFDWGAAILTGCIITAMGLTVLLAGVYQLTL